jgi:hypothetical protein
VASVAPDSSLPSAGASFATHRLMPQAEGRLAAVRGTLVDARCSGIAPRSLASRTWRLLTACCLA